MYFDAVEYGCSKERDRNEGLSNSRGKFGVRCVICGMWRGMGGRWMSC